MSVSSLNINPYKPGIGIGRGRGSLKSNSVNRIPSHNDVNIKSSLNVDAIHIKCSDENENKEIMPSRVTYVPNDDFDDYKLHVDSGINFDKFEDVKVKVTGENIPSRISNLADLNVPDFIIENLTKFGFKTLTPVQKHTIPIIMESRDVMACAETGSGKTAAFLVPIINMILNLKGNSVSKRNSPHCVIMVPSRELCRQVYTAAVEISKTSSIRCAYGYGGVEMYASLQKLMSCDILIATPGRLMHYINGDIILLNQLSFLVLDEADKLLSVEFFHEAIQIVIKNARVINSRDLHISMFSATFPREIQCLAQTYLHDYLFVAVGIVGAANSDIKQTLIPVTTDNKLEITLDYIANNKLGKTLIFVRRKRLADFYGIRLIEMGLTATTIHGDRDQIDREKALNDFKRGRVDVLVATDVASRGLDIPHVDTVFNVDMPSSVDVYVHRIGRSGRCGNPGSAVSFFDTNEDYHMAPRLCQILRGSKQRCPTFLTQLSNGSKIDNGAIKSNTKDMRCVAGAVQTTPSTVMKHFMNMTDDSCDEDEVE